MDYTRITFPQYFDPDRDVLPAEPAGEEEAAPLLAAAEHYIFSDHSKGERLLNQLQRYVSRLPRLQASLEHLAALLANQQYRYEDAIRHFQQALSLPSPRENPLFQATLFIDLSGTYINLERYEEALNLLTKARRLLAAFPEEKLQVWALGREGTLNLHISDFPLATQQLLEADKQFSLGYWPLVLKDYYFWSLVHSALGFVFLRNGDVRRSIEAHQQALEICKKTGMRSRMSWHYLHIGRGYLALSEIERARAFFQKAVRGKDDLSRLSRAGAFANLGYCAFLEEDYEGALQGYARAEELYGSSAGTNPSNFFTLANWRAQLFLATGNREEAEKHLIQAFELAKDSSDSRLLPAICKDIAEFYADGGDFRNAYDYLQLHIDMQDRHQDQLRQRTLMELEVKYEAEKRRREAELLRLQTSTLQMKALQAQMNPHFMHNALNSIQDFITSRESAKAAKYLAKFARLIRQSLEYSDQEVISLEEEVAFLENYLRINQVLRFNEKMNYRVEVSDELEEDFMGVPAMIVQPYVENAIEHGIRSLEKGGLIRIRFLLQDENNILCIIEDNGIGRQKAGELQQRSSRYRTHRSMGTQITRERLELLHKKQQTRIEGPHVRIIDLHDEQGQPTGTRIRVIIPIMPLETGSN